MKFGRKITLLFATALIALCVSVSCANDEPSVGIEPGAELSLIPGVELDYENSFFDGFDSGINADNWYIAKQSWGESSDGNGGVIPENVNYTDDGILVFSGNGEYYRRGDVTGVGKRKDGTLAGGALISKFVTAPGRYEIKMKVLPRQGACSAFWTFAYDYDTEGNHEIDIEIPGGKESGIIGFDNLLNTNYVKVKYNESQDKRVSDVTDGEVTALNDGRWHTFGFDWYSLEPGEDDGARGDDHTLGKVVYFLDGYVTAVSDVFVPYYETRLWLGVWFPNNTGFVGDARFEKDYMYVDYVSYIPFRDQPCVKFVPDANGVADISEYPTVPVALESVNKVANGSFEFITGSAGSGWSEQERNYTGADLAAAEAAFKEYYMQNYDGTPDGLVRAAFEADNPGLTGSELDAAYDEYKKTKDYKNACIRTERELKEKFIYSGELCVLERGAGYRGSVGASIHNYGLLRQTVDSIYSGFELTLSCKAKGNGEIRLVFLSSGDSVIEGKECYVKVDASDWNDFSLSAVAPEGTRAVRVELCGSYGGVMQLDNVSLEVA